ncbi:MAG: transposase [Rhodocyclaceae bacterium]|jgi:hypothetical protein|nr:transposase [Rhodocyclaceae bacterium]
MTSDFNTLPLALGPAPGDCEALWVPAETLAELAGIRENRARDALRKCYEGGTWRKHSLLVRTPNGGPASASNPYQVRVDTLPPALYIKWLEQRKKALPAPAARLGDPIPMPAQIDPKAAKQQTEIDWKARILAPAMEYDEHSPGRIQVMKEIAAKTHIGLDGKPKPVKLRTLYDWISRIKEAGGLHGLARKPRLEKPDRHLICRTWDNACPLSEPVKQDIAREIETYVRSLWAAGVPGWSDCNQKASSKLLELSKAAGWEDATFKACLVGRYFVKKHSETKLIAIKEKDAKRWFDHYTPRIERSREGLRPADIVVGDVHPVDIVVCREDGTEGTYRLIAWLDIATNDLFCTLVLLAPGKGITQAHVANSFAAMVRAWGLPRLLMLDNGSEYSWTELERGFRELAALADDLRILMREGEKIVVDDDDSLDVRTDPILRALPHRPCSKPIEGIFGVLEQLLSMLPGWIGGDRMNKRTHKMGKAPKPFPGAPEKFEAVFYQALAYYRTKPQKGLGGRSPDQTRADFNAESIAPPPSLPFDALVFAFSEEKTPKVQTGGIEVDGKWYQGDELVKRVGQRVTVRYAKWAPDYVFMLDDGRKLVMIPRRPIFSFVGGAGAKEQSRLASVQNAYVRELKATTRKVDLPTEMSRHVAAVGLNVSALKGPEILLTPELAAAVDAASLPPPALPPEEIGPAEVLDRKTGEITPLVPDHYANRPQRREFEDYGELPDWRQQAAAFLPNEKPSEGATPLGSGEAIPKTGTTR